MNTILDYILKNIKCEVILKTNKITLCGEIYLDIEYSWGNYLIWSCPDEVLYFTDQYSVITAIKKYFKQDMEWCYNKNKLIPRFDFMKLKDLLIELTPFISNRSGLDCNVYIENQTDNGYNEVHLSIFKDHYKILEVYFTNNNEYAVYDYEKGLETVLEKRDKGDYTVYHEEIIEIVKNISNDYYERY